MTPKASVGSNPTLSARMRKLGSLHGRVSERLKEHDWKSCGVNSSRGFESHPVRFEKVAGRVVGLDSLQAGAMRSASHLRRVDLLASLHTVGGE